MHNHLKYCLLLLLTATLLASCDHNVVYSEYRSLPFCGWDADSSLVFTPDITDTLSVYDVLLHVRHTQNYPYQNMWLFLDTPAGRDTIEFYLADQRGRWLGNGFGNIKEMPVLYATSVRFPHTGEYQYVIRQGMREECLHGVQDVGLTIEKQ